VAIVAVLLALTPAVRAEQPVAEGPAQRPQPGTVRPLMGLPPELADLSIRQNLGAQVPADLVFLDEDGKQVKLGDYFGKPTILVLAYLRCPSLCNQVLNKLVEGLRPVKYSAGQDFTILTVSFDAREKPELAHAKRASYLDEYNRPGAGAGWHFLTGAQPEIDRLAETVGFRFRYDKEHDRFAHASGLILLTPQGKVARYLLGIDYPSRVLQLSLVEASENKVHSFEDQLMLLCLQYDGATGKYALSVLFVVRAAAVLTVLMLAVFIYRACRRSPQPAPTDLTPAG
jgi:protein SCO1/2